MREILFRGKIVRTGEWVCGGIVHQTDHYGEPVDRYYIIDGTETQDYDIGYEYEVIPETVGQFTGLRDKNGKRIFEGDIVDVEYDIQYVGVASERIGLFEVVFYDGCFMKQKKDGGLFHFIPSDKCKVVGNIHDNLELLEDKR